MPPANRKRDYMVLLIGQPAEQAAANSFLFSLMCRHRYVRLTWLAFIYYMHMLFAVDGITACAPSDTAFTATFCPTKSSRVRSHFVSGLK